jgi:hypothetical protein
MGIEKIFFLVMFSGNCSFVVGAEGGTRTRTTLRSLDPEPSVSTIPPLRRTGKILMKTKAGGNDT